MGGGFYWAHADELGTVRARTNSAGALAESYSSGPWGDNLSQQGAVSALHYTGKGEKIRDVIRSRGGTASNVNETGHWADRTLGEAADAAANGDRSAKKATGREAGGAGRE